MGHSEFDPASRERRPWNAGRMVGAKRALKPQQVWAIRFWLDRERRLRDRALFIVGKPKGSLDILAQRGIHRVTVPLRLWAPVALQEHPDRLFNCVLGRDG
jgi:hypothetical protein